MTLEVLLIKGIIILFEGGNLENVALLVPARIFLSLIFSIGLSFTIIQWATKKRISIMRKNWMRSVEVQEKLSNYLLTLFDHLIQFGMLARIRIIADIAHVIILSTYVLSSISFGSIWLILGLLGAAAAFLGLLYMTFSSVGKRTALYEQQIVSCARLLVQRGSCGWSDEALMPLWLKFTEISMAIQTLYTARIASAQGIRSVIEFAVFLFVSGGLLIGSGYNVFDISASDTVLILLVMSRLAPLAFTIFSNLSTLGFGSYARKIYL